MKRTVVRIWTLCLAMVLLLSACGQPTQPTETPPGSDIDDNGFPRNDCGVDLSIHDNGADLSCTGDRPCAGNDENAVGKAV